MVATHFGQQVNSFSPHLVDSSVLCFPFIANYPFVIPGENITDDSSGAEESQVSYIHS
jgi:hypothetical protein